MNEEVKAHKIANWNEDAKELLLTLEIRLHNEAKKYSKPKKELIQWLEEQKKLLQYANEVELIGHMLKMDSEGMIDAALMILKGAIENAG